MDQSRPLRQSTMAKRRHSSPECSHAPRKKTRKAVTQASPRKDLLDLPAEIRVLIWDMVLIDDHNIVVSDDSTKQPALLAVSRQIRNEGIQTYYSRNHFEVPVRDYNIEPVLLSIATINRYYSPALGLLGPEDGISFILRGVHHWDNLIRWLKATYDGKMTGPTDPNGRDDKDYSALCGMFRIVLTLPGAWSSFEAILPGLRLMMGASNEEWLVEFE